MEVRETGRSKKGWEKESLNCGRKTSRTEREERGSGESMLYHSKGEGKKSFLRTSACLEHQEVLSKSPGLRCLVHSRKVRMAWIVLQQGELFWGLNGRQATSEKNEETPDSKPIWLCPICVTSTYSQNSELSWDANCDRKDRTHGRQNTWIQNTFGVHCPGGKTHFLPNVVDLGAMMPLHIWRKSSPQLWLIVHFSANMKSPVELSRKETFLSALKE